jgi:CRP-like cAMP-binding protein
MHDFHWKDIPIFQDMTDGELDKVRPIFDIVSLEKNQKLIKEGDTGDHMFVLVHGKVRVTKSMIVEGLHLPLEEVRNPRKVLATLDSSICPVFGEMALLDEDLRSATVETVEDSRFLKTSRDQFFDLVSREPVIGCKLLTILGRRLAANVRRSNSELIKLTTALALALSQVK